MADGALFSESWSGEQMRFTVEMDARYFISVAFNGRGSNAGTEAFIGLVERCIALPGARGQLRGLVDLTRLDGAPLRSQLTLGRWLLGRRDAFARIAIVGGGRLERGLAQAVLSMARMDKVAYMETVAEARAFLGV